MRTKLILVTAAVAAVTLPAAGASAAAPVGREPVWQELLAGPAGLTDLAEDVVVDPTTGTVIVTGNSAGSDGDTDVLTAAYSSGGTLLWTARVEGAAGGRDEARALAFDGQRGRIYVSGIITGAGSEDMLTVAYDLSGAELWRVAYDEDGDRDELGQANGVDAATGTVYVAGFSRGFSFRNLDYVTQAISPSGQVLWTQRLSGPGRGGDIPNALVPAPAGGVYVTGSSDSVNGTDVLTVAYDSAGQQRWTARLAGSGAGGGADIALAPGGERVYVTGNRSSTTAVTAAYAADGDRLWSRNLDAGSAALSNLSRLAVDPATGSVYATGFTLPSGGHAQLTTVAYTPAGAIRWVNRATQPTLADTTPADIAVDVATGSVYVAGNGHQPGSGLPRRPRRALHRRRAGVDRRPLRRRQPARRCRPRPGDRSRPWSAVRQRVEPGG